MSEPFVGEVRMFPYTFPPRNWAYCDGTLLAISQNPMLYAIIGTIYGGDGYNTMMLPDLNGRVPMHFGHGPGLNNYPLGYKSGSKDTTLLPSNLPKHRHTARAILATGATGTPSQGVIVGVEDDPNTKIFNNDGVSLQAMDDSAIASEGGGQAHENRQPYLATPFCIALDGIFPSRN